MKKFLLLLFSLYVINCLHSQSIDSLLEQYNRQVPQEKIYVHFDNNVYLPGEPVFYKAYLLQGNELSIISKDLYLYFFDEQGKLIDRNISPLSGYTWSGSFTVPATYTGNRLRVLAYTKWMLNFDSAFLFQRTLVVAQPGEKNIDKTALIPSATLQFFPEGGDLVENIASFLAFKTLNSAGMPVTVTGSIVNAENQVVTRFSSEHNGMGKTMFTSLPGTSYTAEWEDPQGNKHSTQLPVAKKSGIVLSVNNENGIPVFSIERSQQTEERFKQLQFVATMHQKVILRTDVDLTETNKLKADLNVSSYPSGILRLTILDKNAQPVAERILFVNNEEYSFPVTISADTLSFLKRGKNSFSIELSDNLQASLSLAVTAGEAAGDPSQNIISELLLSSEIKGHIHDPAFYFSDADSSKHFLDLVMMTNGWRRFNWAQVMNKALPPLIYPRDTGYVTLTGRIQDIDANRIKLAGSLNLILTGKESARRYLFTPLLPDGSFREDNLIFFDTTKIFYRLNKISLPSASRVNMNTTFLALNNMATIHPINYLPDTTGATYNKWLALEHQKLEELMKGTTLKEVTVKTRIKTRVQEIEDRYATGLFKDDGIQFNVTDDAVASSFPTLLSYLKNRAVVPGLNIDGDIVSWRTGDNKLGRSVTALFIDEAEAKQEDYSSVFMADVAYIKVFRPPFMMAHLGGAGGAIAVYTKKGNDAAANLTGLDYVSVPGYSPVKEFYSPDYAEQQLNFQQADLRRTILWKPNISFDRIDKKVRISFYNNDTSRSFRVILEGVTTDGRLVHVNTVVK